MSLPILNVVILVLALARLTRLVTFDTIFSGFRMQVDYWETRWHRRKVPTWQPSGASFSYLVQCPWCMSIWLGAAEFGLTYWLREQEWLWWIWGGFAASYLVGLLAERAEMD